MKEMSCWHSVSNVDFILCVVTWNERANACVYTHREL